MLNFKPMVYMADNHYSVISQYYRYIKDMRITNKVAQQTFLMINFQNTLSNVDAGETAPTPVTTVLSLQNLMDANKFLVLFHVI